MLERKGPLASVVAALCWRSQAAFCSALPKSCSERLGYVLDECHSDVRGRTAYTPHAQILLLPSCVGVSGTRVVCQSSLSVIVMLAFYHSIYTSETRVV